MKLDEMCACCGVIRYALFKPEDACPWCGYDPKWNAKRRRTYIRAYRRAKESKK